MGVVVVFIVDMLIVEYQWMVYVIEFWQMIKCYYIGDNGVYDIWDWWIFRDFYDWFVGDYFIDRCCLGWIGVGGLDVISGGVVFSGDNSVGVCGGVFQFFNKWVVVVDIEYFLFF